MSSFVISATGSPAALIDAREEAALTLPAGSDELKAAEPMKLLRAERDRLIAETDWWASSDLAGSMSGARTAYRQALRDITKSATSLDDVTWPTKPE